MIAVIDYGVGNLFSLISSLQYLGLEAKVTGSADEIHTADRIILPGVGAFADAMNKLRQTGLDTVIKEQAASGKPLLGICLGMQVLFEKGLEYGEHDGLGLLKGEVVPILGDLKENLKIPHMGWNRLKITRNCPLLKHSKNGDYVYYVHSYYAKNCAESVAAVSDYGIDITGVVVNGNVMGTQFHPEKSGETGLNILSAFGEL
ncbi:imidazole glycerol phosphate synthase subunit HisH [Hydrogenoanaerobacterium sp.]|uniref:imidazole glycerol phosphate synthase subunit HisH n=1 Tax=Hydrogenoanaerobacterium sp. TaxID=2953763 RepID=UPI00289EB536|nr:imidazole glycerol phosphate synthase subunit HisH [Hydrogenoanaerobacterium sp.]